MSQQDGYQNMTFKEVLDYLIVRELSYNDIRSLQASIFPCGSIEEDNYGQIIIYTGLTEVDETGRLDLISEWTPHEEEM